ncbi:MAG TPA: thioredoxin domain-containing protein [Candidatus Limnocylindria bacterium]|nr:thioredoxin domain-containing protein [Candidatus Limnocylindria bacterium]
MRGTTSRLDGAPRTTWHVAGVLAATAGLAASVYLLVEYLTGQSGICLTGSGCDSVRGSAYAYPLGIPMPAFGVAYFSLAAWLSVSSVDGTPLRGVERRHALLVLAGIGALGFAVLTAIEAFIIGAFCSWCLVAAFAGWTLLVAAVGAWREGRGSDQGDEGRSSRARQHRAQAIAAARSRVRRALGMSGAASGLLVVSLLLLGMQQAPAPSAADSLAPEGSPRLGSGAVTLVEFSDFQCPACATVSPVLHQLAANDEVTLVYRHFPLESIHANALGAARAAAAAQRQQAFWPMAEALFARQAEWQALGTAQADTYFVALAGQLGLDQTQWGTDYASDAVRDQVAADARAASELRLRGTPSVFIDGEPHEGPMSLDALRAAIADARGG